MGRGKRDLKRSLEECDASEAIVNEQEVEDLGLKNNKTKDKNIPKTRSYKPPVLNGVEKVKKEEDSKYPSSYDDFSNPENDASVIPPLSPSIIKGLMDANEALIKICLEFQNKNWTDDPDYIMYQRRLQLNLTYLSSVADHYLNPQKNSLTSTSHISNRHNNDNKKYNSSDLQKQLAISNEMYELKMANIIPRLSKLDLRAAISAKVSMAKKDASPLFKKQSNPAPNPQDLFTTYKTLDPFEYDQDATKYIPLPPFRLPSEVKLPPKSCFM